MLVLFKNKIMKKLNFVQKMSLSSFKNVIYKMC